MLGTLGSGRPGNDGSPGTDGRPFPLGPDGVLVPAPGLAGTFAPMNSGLVQRPPAPKRAGTPSSAAPAGFWAANVLSRSQEVPKYARRNGPLASLVLKMLGVRCAT